MADRDIVEWRIRDVIYAYLLLNILILLLTAVPAFLGNAIGLSTQLNDYELYCVRTFIEIVLIIFPIWLLVRKYPLLHLKDLIIFPKDQIRLLVFGLTCYLIIAFIGFFNIYSKPAPHLMILWNYKGPYLALFLANLLLLAPVFEEIFFRGLVFPILKNRFSFHVGVIFTSVLFAIGHKNVVDALVRSLILTYVYGKANSLLLPILIHAFMNMIAIISALIVFSCF